MEVIKFLIVYSTLTLSIIGYGFIFSKYLVKFNKIELPDLSIGYIGLFGIFFLTFISYLTNIFFAHSNSHNLIIHIIGLISFLILLALDYQTEHIYFLLNLNFH